MSNEIRSFARWVVDVEQAAHSSRTAPVNAYRTRADLVVRTPETQDVEFPGVGAKMLDGEGEIVTIEGVPFVSSLDGRVSVPVNRRYGPCVRPLSNLRPIPPLKKYVAIYEGESPEDVRKRYSVPAGVRLEEKP